MKQITVRLSTEVIEELDRSRAEVIRDELNPGEDADEVERLRNELAATRDEYEADYPMGTPPRLTVRWTEVVFTPFPACS